MSSTKQESEEGEGGLVSCTGHGGSILHSKVWPHSLRFISANARENRNVFCGEFFGDAAIFIAAEQFSLRI